MTRVRGSDKQLNKTQYYTALGSGIHQRLQIYPDQGGESKTKQSLHLNSSLEFLANRNIHFLYFSLCKRTWLKGSESFVCKVDTFSLKFHSSYNGYGFMHISKTKRQLLPKLDQKNQLHLYIHVLNMKQIQLIHILEFVLCDHFKRYKIHVRSMIHVIQLIYNTWHIFYHFLQRYLISHLHCRKL